MTNETLHPETTTNESESVSAANNVEYSASDLFLQRYKIYKENPEDNFKPDPTGTLTQGEFLELEDLNGVFMGIDESGEAIISIKNEETGAPEYFATTADELHRAVTNEKQAPSHEPTEVIEAVAVEIPQKPKEENNKQGIPNIKKVLGWISEAENGKTVNIPPHVLAAHKENPVVAKYISNQSMKENTTRAINDEVLAEAAFAEKSGEILESVKNAIFAGDGNTVPEEMLSVFKNDPTVREFLISREQVAGNMTTPEEEKASQVVRETRRDHIINVIDQGKGDEIPFHVLKDYKREPVVQEYILNKILSNIETNNVEFLESIQDWNWKLGAVSTHPVIIDYLAKRLRSGAAQPSVEKEPRPTAIEQLKEKHIVLPVPPTEEIISIPAQPEVKKDLSWNPEVVDSLTLVPKEEKVIEALSSSHDPMNRYWEENMPSMVIDKEREGKLNFALTPKEGERVPVNTEPQPSVSPEISGGTEVFEETESAEKNMSPKETVSPLIAVKFAESFGISHEQLEEIEGFAQLSRGKQLLLLKNMQSEILLDVTRGAEKEQKEEWGGRSLWGKIWRSTLTIGSYEFARTKAMEKEILARSQGVNPADFKRIESLAAHIANIEEYVKVMEILPEVEVKDNETLEVQYVSAKSLFGSVENKRLTSENLKIIEEFNAAASKFATIPHEWGYEPMDEKTRREHAEFSKGRESYVTARENLLMVLSENAKLSGEANPERSALLAMNRIDEQMELNQLFSAHPRVEEVLNGIKDQNTILAGVKEFWRDKGFYVALGAGVRIGVGSVFGSLTGGLGALLAAGIGAEVGKITGEFDARKIIRNRRIDRRLSEEDAREELSYEVPLRNENKEIVTGSNGESLTEQKFRNIKEFTDAAFFVDRIERLIDKLHEAQTPEDRSLLESKIAKTTAVMEEKFNQGLINFGGSSLEAGNARKGNVIANKLSFIQALGKGAAVEVIDGQKLKAEVAQMVSSHQEKIEQVRDEEVVKAGNRAAFIRGAFTFGGVLVVEGVHQSGIVDRIFEQSNGTNEEAVSSIKTPTLTAHDDVVGVEEKIAVQKETIPLKEIHLPKPVQEPVPAELPKVHVPQSVGDTVVQTPPAAQPPTPVGESPSPAEVYQERHLPPVSEEISDAAVIQEVPQKWEPVEYVERHLPPPEDFDK